MTFRLASSAFALLAACSSNGPITSTDAPGAEYDASTDASGATDDGATNGPHDEGTDGPGASPCSVTCSSTECEIDATNCPGGDWSQQVMNAVQACSDPPSNLDLPCNVSMSGLDGSAAGGNVLIRGGARTDAGITAAQSRSGLTLDFPAGSFNFASAAVFEIAPPPVPAGQGRVEVDSISVIGTADHASGAPQTVFHFADNKHGSFLVFGSEGNTTQDTTGYEIFPVSQVDGSYIAAGADSFDVSAADAASVKLSAGDWVVVGELALFPGNDGEFDMPTEEWARISSVSTSMGSATATVQIAQTDGHYFLRTYAGTSGRVIWKKNSSVMMAPTLENLSIQSTNTKFGTLYVAMTQRATLQNLVVYDGTSTQPASLWSNNAMTVTGCHFQALDGLSVEVADDPGITFENNVIELPPGSPTKTGACVMLLDLGSDGAIVANNQFTCGGSLDAFGLIVDNLDTATIDYNTFTGGNDSMSTYGAGIQVQATSHVQIGNNDIDGYLQGITLFNDGWSSNGIWKPDTTYAIKPGNCVRPTSATTPATGDYAFCLSATKNAMSCTSGSTEPQWDETQLAYGAISDPVTIDGNCHWSTTRYRGSNNNEVYQYSPPSSPQHYIENAACGIYVGPNVLDTVVDSTPADFINIDAVDVFNLSASTTAWGGALPASEPDSNPCLKW